MDAIFDLRLTPTSHGVHISPVVFLDRGNAGMVIGISLLSCVWAKTYVFHTFFRFMAVILISGLNAINTCISSKPNLDALSFSANSIKKFLLVSKIMGASEAPSLASALTTRKTLRRLRGLSRSQLYCVCPGTQKNDLANSTENLSFFSSLYIFLIEYSQKAQIFC